MAISPSAGAFLLARAYNKKELLALNKTKKSLMLSRIFS